MDSEALAIHWSSYHHNEKIPVLSLGILFWFISGNIVPVYLWEYRSGLAMLVLCHVQKKILRTCKKCIKFLQKYFCSLQYRI